jgi:putative tricarboxylic transport membrane protein
MSQGVTPSQGRGQHPDSHANTNSVMGGILLTVFSLILFAMTFALSGPSVFRLPTSFFDLMGLIFDPRILSVGLAAIGILTTMNLIPVRAPQDYYGGLVLVMVATLAIIASYDLPGQRGFAFGPGTAPRLFAGVLTILGIAVAVVGVTVPGPAIEKYKLRGPLYVLAAICTFALIIRPYGLVIAAFVTFMIAIYGSTEMRWIESVIAAVGMTIFCVILFVHLLNLPFQLKPVDWTTAHVAVWHGFADFFKLIFGPLLKAMGLM